MVTRIYNGVFVTDDLITGKSLYIENEKILALTDEELPFDEDIDAKGLYVSPGFIDIHSHGGGGYDFADGSVNDVLCAALSHAKHGTTTIFPTSASMSFESTKVFVENVKEATKENSPGKPSSTKGSYKSPKRK